MGAPTKLARPLQCVRSADLPWEVLGTHGLKRRLLGHDPESGHVTNIVFIPEGWHGGGVAHFHDAFEEVYMLDGAVTLDGDHYFRKGVYFYRPAQVVHGHDERSETGALALVRSDGALVLNLVHQPEQPVEYPRPGHGDPRGHVFETRVASVAAEADAALHADWKAKPLSADPVTGARTFEAIVPAGWQGIAPALGQPWEAYVLEGDLSGARESWQAGDYTVGDADTPLLGTVSSTAGARILVMTFGERA
ncbi:DUF4437 domain-containing protein [Novosphingobium sp. KCTC 2891]|uniref:cupin domain-containing protein n=1 Tax=Novosphingobium sp. KCTC 2891 TaxID=2989730 RepID=UPI0022224530|nr:DUF4437 domain-containing protein [Novosphingobium sp. KCTC 2891]MCW1383816.1 DUF4437 domain-containing protein [Novosphingobium sp. KCTC 2891]